MNRNSHPSVLFVDQTGELGGAELSLFDIVRLRTAPSSVVLLADGPLRTKLANASIPTSVVPIKAAGQVTRDSSLSAALLAGPGLARATLSIAIKARNADLIYANTQKAFIVSAAASIIARKPLIWHLRDILTNDHFSRSLLKAVIILSNHCNARIIANSQATADAYKMSGGTADITIIHNGIDATPFDAVDTGEARALLRAELNLNDQPLVGVFSRLAEWKGQHVLVDALRHLPGIHAVFVGGALFEENAYEKRLKEQVDAFGLKDRCHFLGFRSDVPKLMKAVDLIAHTSIAPEPFGRVIVEGMLAGRPVIGTRAGGVTEIITDGVTGYLVAPGNTDELVDAIRRLTTSYDHARLVANASQHAARRNFSLAGSLSKIDEFIYQSYGH